MKEMVGGCCVCSDDSGWPENPLVYCDGPNCTVAVHQACYGIVTVPAGNWFCRKCESLQGNVKVRCELCPNKEGALKPTDNSGWAHVVCALYIPEVRFGNVTTMEPIILAQIPPERFNKTCDICEKNFRGSGRAKVGACMQCNKPGCRVQFHVTCAQSQGLLCEEAGNNTDNVKYCGYCQHHYTKLKKGAHVKVILPYRPITNSFSPEGSPVKEIEPVKTTSKRKLSTSSSSKVSGLGSSGGGTGGDDLCTNDEDSQSSNKTTGGQDSDLKLMPGKRKKGSRTPPVSGVSPEASPRPITPLNSSTSSANSSTGPSSSSLLNVSSVVVTPPTLLSVPPPPPPPPTVPASSPSGVVVQPSTTPQRQSTTPPLPLNSTSQDVKKSGQSGFAKESRPNSIVVNVPLEVALPTATSATSNPPERRTPPRIDASAPIPSPLLPTVQLEDINHVAGAIGNQSHSHSSAPSKRARSQSGDKSDKTRRSSKRSSGSSGTTGSKNMSSPPRSSHSSREKSDGSGHHNHHSGGGSSHHHHGGYNSDHIKASGRRHHSSSSSTSHSTTTTSNNSSSLSTNHLSHQQPGGSAASNLNQHLVHIPASTTTPSTTPINNITTHSSAINPPGVLSNKEDKPDMKILPSTNVNVPHMLGNTLNPSSTMAQKMCDTLSQEIVAHSVYSSAANGSGSNPLVGPQLPQRASTSSTNATSSASGTNNNNNIWMSTSSTPQSLEQLLERQWEQGSQFLMEQAQHFDIASLLSCLHQLRAENAQLEDHVNSLIQRRDHLLAVNARLAIPLVPPATSASTVTPSSASQSGPSPNQQVVENGLPPSVSPHETPYRGSSTIRQLPSGGGGGSGGQPSSLPSVNNPVFNTNNPGGGQQNSVLVRASSSDSRRSSQSPAAAGPYGQIYQQNALLNQSQVVMRRDVIEAVNSVSSNTSQSSQQRSSHNNS